MKMNAIISNLILIALISLNSINCNYIGIPNKNLPKVIEIYNSEGTLIDLTTFTKDFEIESLNTKSKNGPFFFYNKQISNFYQLIMVREKKDAGNENFSASDMVFACNNFEMWNHALNVKKHFKKDDELQPYVVDIVFAKIQPELDGKSIKAVMDIENNNVFKYALEESLNLANLIDPEDEFLNARVFGYYYKKEYLIPNISDYEICFKNWFNPKIIKSNICYDILKYNFELPVYKENNLKSILPEEKIAEQFDNLFFTHAHTEILNEIEDSETREKIEMEIDNFIAQFKLKIPDFIDLIQSSKNINQISFRYKTYNSLLIYSQVFTSIFTNSIDYNFFMEVYKYIDGPLICDHFFLLPDKFTLKEFFIYKVGCYFNRFVINNKTKNIFDLFVMDKKSLAVLLAQLTRFHNQIIFSYTLTSKATNKIKNWILGFYSEIIRIFYFFPLEANPKNGRKLDIFFNHYETFLRQVSPGYEVFDSDSKFIKNKIMTMGKFFRNSSSMYVDYKIGLLFETEDYQDYLDLELATKDNIEEYLLNLNKDLLN